MAEEGEEKRVFESEKKFLPERKNSGAAVERGARKDYVTVETLENSVSWTGKTYNRAMESSEILRW